MRENESDSGDGWREPYDYARDRGGADQAPADDPDLPQESDRPDTIAFGSLADETDGAGQGFYAQRGYGDPWYSGDEGEPGYGSYAGPGGRYGSESASGVIVTVAVSPFAPFPANNDDAKQNKTKEVRLWVQFKDQSLGFAP